MTRFLILTASTLSFVSVTVAADQPTSQPPPAPPVVGKAPIGKAPIGKAPIGNVGYGYYPGYYGYGYGNCWQWVDTLAGPVRTYVCH